MKPIRVLIADDHALVRAGFRALLEKIEGVVCVGEAGKGSEALLQVEELKPNLMLLDITMPDGSGFDVLKDVTKNFPDVRVIMLTVHEAREYAIHALREGAAGFIPKSAATTELEQAIQTVMRGEVYMRTSLRDDVERTKIDLLKTLSPRQREVLSKIDLLKTLSPRQREVLCLLAKGLSNKEIALTLDINVKTVETHRGKLTKKLGIYDVAGLTRFAIIVGLIKVDE